SERRGQRPGQRSLRHPALFDRRDARQHAHAAKHMSAVLEIPALRLNICENSRGPVIYPPTTDRGQCGPAKIFLPVNHTGSAPLTFTGIFSAEECDSLTPLGASLPNRAGRMMYAQYQRRRSQIAWIGIRHAPWLYEKVWKIFQSVNRWYGFELVGLV